MERLRGLDEVAYVRFASVYRSFCDINTFMEELKKLLGKPGAEENEKTEADPESGSHNIRRLSSMPSDTILAVDDEVHILELISFNLKAAGYHVVTALTGEEALKRCEVEKPSLVLLTSCSPALTDWKSAAA